jgi:ferredoxin
LKIYYFKEAASCRLERKPLFYIMTKRIYFAERGVQNMAPLIIINRERCVNTNYKKMNCQRCREWCPCHCIEASLDVDAARCNQCGMCLAACPAEAIAGENYRLEGLQRLLIEAKSPVVLSCRKEDSTSDWPCLGFLDGRLLLTLVLSGKDANRSVVLNDQACMGCRPVVAEYLKKLGSEVNKFLVGAGKLPVSVGNNINTVRHSEAVSRRAFFAQLVEATVNTVREVVAANAFEAQSLPRRQLFASYADKLVLDRQDNCSLFYNICISDLCKACELCSKVCPEKAISICDHGASLDIYHIPLKCTGCGLCAIHCPQTALVVTAASELEKYHVAGPELPCCLTCGQLYQPVGKQTMCLECLLKSNQRIIS